MHLCFLESPSYLFVFYVFQVSDFLLLMISTFLFSSALSFALKKTNKFLPRPCQKKALSTWGNLLCHSFSKVLFKIINFWLCWAFAAVQAFSLVAAGRLLIAVASLVMEHEL